MSDKTFFTLTHLPYGKKAFGKSFLTKESFDYHYNKHHASYVNNLNALLQNEEELQSQTLENIIKSTSLNKTDAKIIKIYNNAAQVWNHDFFWMSITPEELDKTNYQAFNLIQDEYGSWEQFVDSFVKSSTAHFGSGWSWLMLNKSKNKKSLEIVTTINAVTMIEKTSHIPLFVCDLWEHAYYIDFRNDRKTYVHCFLTKYLNWNFIQKNLDNAYR